MNRPLGLSENKATRLRGLDLNDFINHPISADMIKVVADEARRIVPTNLAIDLCKPVETTGNRLPTLEGFITQLVKKLKISFGTLLSSLVYIRRLNSILSGYRNDYISAPDRICLVSLILAAKYLHDITYENKCWVRSTELIIKKRTYYYSLNSINYMEFQALSFLEYDLRIYKRDLYTAFGRFLESSPPKPIRDLECTSPSTSPCYTSQRHTSLVQGYSRLDSRAVTTMALGSVSENQRHRKEKKMRRRLVSSPDHQVILGSELETPYDGGYD